VLGAIVVVASFGQASVTQKSMIAT
jgi:hypothetical protein